MPPLDRTHSRYSIPSLHTNPLLGSHWWAHKWALIDPSWWLTHCQDAERSCSHLGTMVEFAVALGSKLDVINKHSFNNFRLRVGKGFPLLGQSGTSSSSSKAFLPQVLCYLLFQVWSMKLLGLKLRGILTPAPRPYSFSSTLFSSKGPEALLPSSMTFLFPTISSNLPSFYHISCQG